MRSYSSKFYDIKYVFQPMLSLRGIESDLQFDNQPLKEISELYKTEIDTYIKTNCKEIYANIFEILGLSKLDLSKIKYEIGINDDNNIFIQFYHISDKLNMAILDKIRAWGIEIFCKGIGWCLGKSDLFIIKIEGKQEWFHFGLNIVSVLFY